MLETILAHQESQFAFGIILSVIIGFAIGLEREYRGKDAGVSTHTLVIMGSMLFTFISVHIEGSDSTSRIAAQIVSGIGFLGAGLILKEGHSVRNLTTAASLWFAAAIGMAIGFGFYVVAILSALVGILILRIPHLVQEGIRNEDHVK